jgi:hypothetical protein
MVGPVIGPIAGGFIAQTVGMKYVFIVIAGETQEPSTFDGVNYNLV